MGNAEETRTIEQVVQRTGCSFCFVPMSKWDLKPEQSEHENMNNAVKITGCTSYFGDTETTIPKTKGSGFFVFTSLHLSSLSVGKTRSSVSGMIPGYT